MSDSTKISSHNSSSSSSSSRGGGGGGGGGGGLFIAVALVIYSSISSIIVPCSKSTSAHVRSSSINHLGHGIQCLATLSQSDKRIESLEVF